MTNRHSPERDPHASADDARHPSDAAQQQPGSMEEADVANGEGEPDTDTDTE